jgi:hypothetical protein
MFATIGSSIETYPPHFGSKIRETRQIGTVPTSNFDTEMFDQKAREIQHRDRRSELRIEPTKRSGVTNIADTILILAMCAAGATSIMVIGMLAINAYSALITLSPVNIMRVVSGAL